MKRYLPIGYLVLVFLCGTAVGVFGYRFYELRTVTAGTRQPHSPDEIKAAYLAEMKSKLNLDGAQMSEVSTILDQTREQYRALMDRNRPAMDSIQRDQYTKVKAVLRPEQIAAFEKFHADRERRRQERVQRPRF